MSNIDETTPEGKRLAHQRIEEYLAQLSPGEREKEKDLDEGGVAAVAADPALRC